MLLHIILLLAIAISVTSATFSKKDQKAIADQLNVVRAKYAEMENIGNMHEVKFDEDLLKIAVRIANCEDLKGGIDIVKKSELEETSTNSGAVPMHLLPMRTEIACVQNLLTCTKFSEPICLLAPYTTEKQIKRGSIGSECTNGVVERKLCKAPRPAPAPSQ
ncbi:hypothetical protein B9Z55_027274 [Caenorhabditis nigoni]|nr:hypothetical protein B9Z55_027274 [Caenorhabditis nigoni]